MEKKVFFGSDLSVADYEALTIARIKQDLRTRESDLLKSKWFDYRFIHPAKATYLFAALYADEVKRAYIQTKDVNSADSVKAFKPDDVFQSRDLTGFWIARQRFDAIGVRYGFGIGFMMRRFIHERNWHMFPRPNQLYAEEAILDLRDAWRTHCANILELPTHPVFKDPENETEAATAFREWIVGQAKLRAHHHMPLSRIIMESHLTPDQAERYFGAQTADKAVALANSLSA